MTADWSKVLLEFLEGGAALVELVGTNIWQPIAPSTADFESPMITFSRAGGSEHQTGNNLTAQIKFKCYGGDSTYAKAREVYLALKARLKQYGAVTTSGRIVSADETGVQELSDPDGTPYIWASWTIIMA